MTLTRIAALFGTILILALAPGPSDFAVVARSIAAGFPQALIMVSGIVIADILWIVLAVYGLAEVAESMGTLFIWVKYACGAYLVGLGVGSLRSKSVGEGVPTVGGKLVYSSSSSFLGGLLITLGDPKAILFYMGLLPAFVNLATLSVADLGIIMTIATGVVGGVKATYAYLADRAKRLFEHPPIRRKMDVAAGGVLVCTGAFLLLG